MTLPTRIVDRAPREPVISVDGAFGARGLALSHWPGNTTPAALRHDLSTGAALAFAALPEEERRRWRGDAVAICNNHYDTDGACAAFAASRPAEALARADALLAAAAAGDFFRLPSREALALDAVVQAYADVERSPIAGELRELGDHARWSRAQAALLERLPALVDGGLRDLRPLWEPAVRAAEADVADLARAERVDVPALDLVLWSAPRGARSSRPAGCGAPAAAFDPGRHALFGTTRADRALVLAPGPEGTTCRLVVSTLSWFDLASGRRSPRPDLGRLAAELNDEEGCAPDDERAWRAQPSDGPSPELWFGEVELAAFAEHNPSLRPSRLAPARLRALFERALG